MSENVDVIVVGAGMAGATVAAELVGAASVLLIEAETRPGHHATGRSAALYAPGYGGGPVRTLTLASHAALLQADAQGRHFLKPRGGLFVATHAQAGSLAAMARSSGGTLAPLDAAETVAMVPILRPEAIAGGLDDSVAADIDVDLLQQSYLRRFQQGGGTLACDEALVSAEASGGGWRVRTTRREIGCGVLVNAAGAWADTVAGKAGLGPLGLQPKRRTAALVEPPTFPGFESWPAVIDIDERFYFKPDAGLLLVSPAEETDVEPHDAYADDMALAEGIERILGVASIAVTKAPRAWAGLRTFAPDRLPVIGGDPRSAPPFLWLAGQGGYGIQMAPAAARLAAALTLGGTLPDFASEAMLAEVSPTRFAHA
ncbi:NAD(P)/FAD-dependent oxidoreductase [Erythrobacter sp. NE805]|uniref:NAD(P)/FAD-dependent oxidoreductase n=1 Tax=Erythrobacter sp. NE805 TaxID=3389875 RepID=UPI00396AF660